MGILIDFTKLTTDQFKSVTSTFGSSPACFLHIGAPIDTKNKHQQSTTMN